MLGGQAFLGSSNILPPPSPSRWSGTGRSGLSRAAPASRITACVSSRLKSIGWRKTRGSCPLPTTGSMATCARYRQSALRELRVLTGDHRSSAEQLREAPIPNSVQQEALMALQAARAQGHKRVWWSWRPALARLGSRL